MERLIMVLLWPLHVAEAGYERFLVWLVTRPWILLAHGAPALVASSVIAGIVAYEWSGADRTGLVKYRQLVTEALDKPDLPAAEIYLRKLTILDESGSEYYQDASWETASPVGRISSCTRNSRRYIPDLPAGRGRPRPQQGRYARASTDP